MLLSKELFSFDKQKTRRYNTSDSEDGIFDFVLAISANEWR